MGNIKFKVKETAGDDHEMHIKLNVEGKSSEVRDLLRHYFGC